jgi:hypothetical protein
VPISVWHVEEALRLLGGEAQIGDILRKVLEIAPLPHPRTARNVIRGRLYQYSSQTSSYGGGPDLFESVDGLAANTGRWRLKSNPPSVIDLNTPKRDTEAVEGRRQLSVHLRLERSRSLIKDFKKSLTDFSCEACGVNLGETYGPLGEGCIEAHHRRPVSQMQEGETTKLSDLAALCPNCHRIIHRNGLMTVEDLARHIRMQTMPYPLAAEPDAAKWEHDAPGEGD